MVLSLVGPLDNHRVQRILLVAAFAGTKLKVVPISIGHENETDSYRRNCHPIGRVPVLKSDEGYLFETNAIIRYLTRTERPYGTDGNERFPSPHHQVPYVLYGKSLQEAAEVDAWLDFVLTELDPHIFPVANAEKMTRGASLQSPPPSLSPATVLGPLQEALHGLEQRLVFKKQLLKLMAAGGGGSSAVPLSARTGLLDDVDDGLSEEDYFTSTPRESTMLRGYHTYNIKTHVEEPQDASSMRATRGINNGMVSQSVSGSECGSLPRISLVGTIPSPRPSLHTPRASAITPRRSTNSSGDILFLVGDSLTAADLVVALAVHLALSTKRFNATIKQQFPQLVRFHQVILRLPIAGDVRKVLGISLL